jgi:hypothetical protein
LTIGEKSVQIANPITILRRVGLQLAEKPPLGLATSSLGGLPRVLVNSVSETPKCRVLGKLLFLILLDTQSPKRLRQLGRAPAAQNTVALASVLCTPSCASKTGPVNTVLSNVENLPSVLERKELMLLWLQTRIAILARLPFKPLYPAAEIASFGLRGATKKAPEAPSMSTVHDSMVENETWIYRQQAPSIWI